MTRSGKALGRNDRCHCGSGKKYKHCHLEADRQLESEAMRAALPEEPPPSPDDITELLDNTLAPLTAYLARQEEIEAALRALKPHHKEFDRSWEDAQAFALRITALFKDDRFKDLRFTADEIELAFEEVGYPQDAVDEEAGVAIIRDAILHLADQDRRSQLSLGVAWHLPDFVAEGRFMDACLIEQMATDTLAQPDASNAFLFAMFLHGYDEWIEQVNEEEDLLAEEIGVSRESLEDMNADEFDAWQEMMLKDPVQKAKMEAFIQSNPDFQAKLLKKLDQAEVESIKLLDRPDAGFLLLSPETVEPWFLELCQRLESLVAVSQPPAPPEAAAPPGSMQTILYSLVHEMAQSVFTPERIQQLLAQLRQYRGELLDSGETMAASQAQAAIILVSEEVNPGTNYFLASICFASLKPVIAGGVWPKS